MSLIEINHQPSRRDLAIFAALFLVFWLVIAAIFPYRLGATNIAITIIIADLIIVTAFTLVPAFRRPLYLTWMYAAWPIGWLFSHLVFVLIYYLALTPIALIIRLRGRDPLQLKKQTDKKSYWIEHTPEQTPARYFRQF